MQRRLTPLLFALALGACGDANGTPRRGMPLPMADVCLPTTGFGWIEFDYTCFDGQADGACLVVIESSNGAVVAISPSVVSIPQGTTQRVRLTTSSTQLGIAILSVLNENNTREQVAVVQVGGC